MEKICSFVEQYGRYIHPVSLKVLILILSKTIRKGNYNPIWTKEIKETLSKKEANKLRDYLSELETIGFIKRISGNRKIEILPSIASLQVDNDLIESLVEKSKPQPICNKESSSINKYIGLFIRVYKEETGVDYHITNPQIGSIKWLVEKDKISIEDFETAIRNALKNPYRRKSVSPSYIRNNFGTLLNFNKLKEEKYAIQQPATSRRDSFDIYGTNYWKKKRMSYM